MKIYFATTNLGKVHTLNRNLKKYGITVTHAPMDLIEPRSSEIQEIALAKINQAYKKIKKPTIVIDSGFYVHALKGFPRAYVNFALETVDLEGILNLVKEKSCECEFRDCLAYMDETLKEPKFFISNFKGSIAKEPRGTLTERMWSRLWLIFIPTGSDKTLAEMSEKDYLAYKKKIGKKDSVGMQLAYWLKHRN